jgi:osmotically-inducible protein OsmY
MNDEDIDKQIIDQLYWDNSVNAADVAVTVKDGWVTLQGTVPSYTAKLTAGLDAYQVRGVRFVDNKLNVVYPEIPTDEQIKADVESILDWDFDLEAQKITVSVRNGEVKLLGTVDKYWKKHLAESNTAKIEGVSNVKNELAIVDSGEWTDEVIAKNIEEALRRNLNVNVDDVDVRVDNARVLLSGEVPNWTARQAAEISARYTRGVTSVENLINIS